MAVGLLLHLALEATNAEPFLNETFQGYTINKPLVGSGGQGLDRWMQRPVNSTVSNLIIDKGIGREKVIEIKNDNQEDVYWLSTSGKESAWKEAVKSSSKVRLRFGFLIPLSAQSAGGKFSLYCQQINSAAPLVGAWIMVQEAGKGKLDIFAVNGTDSDGKGKMVKVGACKYDEWCNLVIEQNFIERTYSVTIEEWGAVEGLSFRMGETWKGDTWGDRAQLSFAINQGTTVLLDDIECSTEAFK